MLSFDELLVELINNMKIGVNEVNAFQPFEWKYVLAPMDDVSGLESWEYTTVNADVLLAELYLWRNEQVNAAESVLSAIGAADGTTKYKHASFKSGFSWINIYTADFSTIDDEAFTALPFEYKLNQQNKLQYYFSNISPNVYYLAPTSILRNLLISKNDRRYSYSWRTENGKEVFARYHYGDDMEPYEHDNYIYISCG
ncbi:MAG: hypothetical protein LIO65_08220 [Odoribacter sp.]|nr:hypothetical protein [Odoribacter sp.]